MSPIMVNNRSYITNNIGKAYMATIMGLFMVLLEVLMHDHQYSVLSLHTYIIVILALVLFIYLYRQQIAITDKQYLEGMIEHHSMGIFTSEEILKKTDDYNVSKIAKNIIQTQNDEIKEMRDLVNK
jgi:Ca2+/Na+ antiporter